MKYLLILLMFCGCTTVDYNPDTKAFRYQAPPWGKKIGKVSVIKEADGSILFEMSDKQVFHSTPPQKMFQRLQVRSPRALLRD